MKQENSLKNRELFEKKAHLEATIRRLESKYQKDSSVFETCKQKTVAHPIPVLLGSIATGFLAGTILHRIGNNVGTRSSKARKGSNSDSKMGLPQLVADEVKRQIAQRTVRAMVEMLEKRSGSKN